MKLLRTILFVQFILLQLTSCTLGSESVTFGPTKPVALIKQATVPETEAKPNTTVAAVKSTETAKSSVELANSNIQCTEKNNPCLISEGLSCLDGVCKCAYPNLMFDPEAKRCHAKVGEQCGFFIGLQNASTVSCPENAICALVTFEMVTDGPNHYSSQECACVYTHYKSPEGLCLPLALHEESCDDVKKCSSEGDLVCINGKCQCRFEGDQFFDPELGACISFAGGNCTRACVPNALCDFYGSGTCQCRVDHRINSESRGCEPIPPGYLSPCLGDKELCNRESGLRCIDKVCQCANPLHQIYDYPLDKCIGLAGDICDPNLGGHCVKNSKCLKSPGNGGVNSFSCQCEEGYSTTPFRKCMKGHGLECSNEFCNVYRGLACVNGSCQCYDSFLRYDEQAKACFAPVGSPCGKIFVPFPGDWVKASCPECDSYYFACDEATGVCKRDFTDGNELGALERFRCQQKPI